VGEPRQLLRQEDPLVRGQGMGRGLELEVEAVRLRRSMDNAEELGGLVPQLANQALLARRMARITRNVYEDFEMSGGLVL